MKGVTGWTSHTQPTRPDIRSTTVSQSQRVGLSAVIGTSVKASLWTRQTEPDGSIPSGSSIQCTCINEDPGAGRAAEDTCIVHSACVSVCMCEPGLTSTDILLQIASCWLYRVSILPLCCMSVLSAYRFSPSLFFVCVHVHTHGYVVSVSYYSFLGTTPLST